MDIEAFISRWSGLRGGAERANYQMFLTELCQALGVEPPQPASDDTQANDYVFERGGVKRREAEGQASTLRIDLSHGHCDAYGHVLPRSRGGPHTPDNIVAACRACNGARGSTDALAFVKLRVEMAESGEWPPGTARPSRRC